jgi:hypothetical protein
MRRSVLEVRKMGNPWLVFGKGIACGRGRYGYFDAAVEPKNLVARWLAGTNRSSSLWDTSAPPGIGFWEVSFFSRNFGQLVVAWYHPALAALFLQTFLNCNPSLTPFLKNSLCCNTVKRVCTH